MNSELSNASYAFPYIALNILPAFLGGLILLAGVSATLSSASSDAIAGVSVLVSDIYAWFFKTEVPIDKQLLVSRIAMIITVLIALMMALLSNSIISYITKMISIALCGMFVMGVLGRFWQSYTWQGSLATLFTSSFAAIYVGINEKWLAFFGNPVIPAVIAGCVFGVLVSLFTRQKSGTKEQTKNEAVEVTS